MARTHPLPTKQHKTLMKTMNNPKCHLSDGKILHGPIFKNLAMPTEADKAETVIVIINIIPLSIPRKLVVSDPLPVMTDSSKKSIVKSIYTVGTASRKGSEKELRIYET